MASTSQVTVADKQKGLETEVQRKCFPVLTNEEIDEIASNTCQKKRGSRLYGVSRSSKVQKSYNLSNKVNKNVHKN